jgi:cholesterol transport system auxiliary component
MRRSPGLVAITLMATVSACSISANRGSPVRHDLGPMAIPTAQDTAVTLDAPVWLWDERIRYRLLYENPTVIRHYNLDRWEAPFPVLLERRLNINGKRPFTVHINLTQFEQQFETVNQARVVMSLMVSVFAARDHRLIANRSFNLSQSTVSPDAAGAIAGFVTLTEQGKTDIQAWLETLSDAERAAGQP